MGLYAADEVAEAQRLIRHWLLNPVEFVRDRLGVDEVDDWQSEVLQAAAAGALGLKGGAVNPDGLNRIALKASKGPGKSTVLSWIGWWFLACFPHPKVVCTSVSGDNLSDGLWTEFAKWQARSPMLQGMFTQSAERIIANDHPDTWWCSARQWAKTANADQQADTLAGIHADNVLILIDESGGIPDGVVAAAEAGLANADPTQGKHALLVQAGNPTHTIGPLYRACTRERALWWVKEISGDPDDPKRAKRVSIQWAREQIQKWGSREHPFVLVNVLGKFPPGQSNTLIGVNDAEEATQRTVVERDYYLEPKVLGVDVARFGDDRSVICMRQGRACFRPKVFRNLDTQELAGQVAMVIERHSPDACFVDITGGVGAGVYDRLRALGFNVTPVEFAGKPLSNRYKNKRAEMWFLMADWIKAGGAIPDDGELLAELTAPTYKFDSAGRLQLEAKETMKERGLPSPDKGDALALTFAFPVMARDEYGQRPSRVVKTDFDPYRRGG